MRIEQLMAKSPKGCPPGHTFSEAAQMIWDHDCGYQIPRHPRSKVIRSTLLNRPPTAVMLMPSPMGGGLTDDGDEVRVRRIPEHIVEIVSDSGEGAQKAGQLFGTVCAKMGNGVWTVEIIPAEIEPPARSRAGASGIRIRIGTAARHQHGRRGRPGRRLQRAGALRPHRAGRAAQRHRAPAREQVGHRRGPEDPRGVPEGARGLPRRGYDVREVPMDSETCKVTDNPQRGKNMWVLGMLCAIYGRDLEIAKDEVQQIFAQAQGRRRDRHQPRAARRRLRLGDENLDDALRRSRPSPSRTAWW